MKDEDLKKRLADVEIPKPGEMARRRALDAALAEMKRSREPAPEKNKGFFGFRRLTGKTSKKGGPVMGKPIVVAAGLAMGCIALAMLIMPNFVSYRMRSDSIAPPAQVPSVQYSAAPQRLQRAMKSAAPATDAAAGPAVALRTAPQRPEAEAPGRLDQAYVGRDRFETVDPNPVKVVRESPVSTFSVDVDTASYAFVRRALNSGVLPQKHAVRIEELINYFDYDYPLPADPAVPFRPTITVLPTPWNAKTRLLHIGIKGLDRLAGEKPRANLVFLIDVSGSMHSPDKLPLLKNAFRMLVDTLDPEDTVAVVVYAGAAGTVLAPTKVKQKEKIHDALDRLRAGGSTAGGEGIRRAYALCEAGFDPEGVNRVILATDGDFNVGIRDPEALKDFVERKRDTGIYLSVLGFGQGNYNDRLMQKLAQNGNGNAAYIDTLNEARKVLVDEVNATLFTIARDVKIQVEFNPALVAEYRLIGYETRLLRREDFNNDRVDAGDVGAGHSVTALYEFVPAGSDGKMIDDLRYAAPTADAAGSSGTPGNEYAFLKIRYKLPDASESRLLTTPIDRRHAVDAVESAPVSARFAAAVAAFGQLLRGDPYVKDFTYDDVIALGLSARGEDRFGYRAEFLNLARLAKSARAMGDQ